MNHVDKSFSSSSSSSSSVSKHNRSLTPFSSPLDETLKQWTQMVLSNDFAQISSMVKQVVEQWSTRSDEHVKRVWWVIFQTWNHSKIDRVARMMLCSLIEYIFRSREVVLYVLDTLSLERFRTMVHSVFQVCHTESKSHPISKMAQLMLQLAHHVTFRVRNPHGQVSQIFYATQLLHDLSFPMSFYTQHIADFSKTIQQNPMADEYGVLFRRGLVLLANPNVSKLWKLSDTERVFLQQWCELSSMYMDSLALQLLQLFEPFAFYTLDDSLLKYVFVRNVPPTPLKQKEEEAGEEGGIDYDRAYLPSFFFCEPIAISHLSKRRQERLHSTWNSIEQWMRSLWSKLFTAHQLKQLFVFWSEHTEDDDDTRTSLARLFVSFAFLGMYYWNSRRMVQLESRSQTVVEIVRMFEYLKHIDVFASFLSRNEYYVWYTDTFFQTRAWLLSLPRSFSSS